MHKRVSLLGSSVEPCARRDRRYQLALSYVDEELLMQLDGPHAEQATAARSSLLLNAAACQLQLDDWHGAIAHCHEVALYNAKQAGTALAAVRTVVMGLCCLALF